MDLAQTLGDAPKPKTNGAHAPAMEQNLEDKRPKPVAIFNKAHGLDWICEKLLEHGFEEGDCPVKDERRYMDPESSTRSHGVHVMKSNTGGDWIVYSHHGDHGKIPSRKTLDSFALSMHLDHGGDMQRALKSAEAEQDFMGARVPASAPPPPPKDFIVTLDQFIKSWKAPEFLIDGIIQRGYCYSFTAPTGHGKTAVALLMSVCVAEGTSFAGRNTVKGKVLYFAAENPTDIQGRMIAMADKLGLKSALTDVLFAPEVTDIRGLYGAIAARLEAEGGVELVVVDTSQAVFGGEDENANAEMVAHAKNMRSLCRLPGGPCVLILTHPTKNAGQGDLLPRGGGGFLAEVDGNLTLWMDGGGLASMGYHGKLRGPGFERMFFELVPWTCSGLVDVKGGLIPSVVAEAMTDADYDARKAVGSAEEEALMRALWNGGGALSVSELCVVLTWTLSNGGPNKSKLHRMLKRLEASKYVRQKRDDKYKLTQLGEAEIGVSKKPSNSP